MTDLPPGFLPRDRLPPGFLPRDSKPPAPLLRQGATAYKPKMRGRPAGQRTGESPDTLINQGHPELSWYDRVRLKNLEERHGPEAMARNLQSLGFETGPGREPGEIAIRKGSDPKWYGVEGRGFGRGGMSELLLDPLDAITDVGRIGAMGAGGAAGASLGAGTGFLGGGPVGAGVAGVAGGAAGAGVAGTGYDFGLDLLSRGLGGKSTVEEENRGQRESMALGAASELGGRLVINPLVKGATKLARRGISRFTGQRQPTAEAPMPTELSPPEVLHPPNTKPASGAAPIPAKNYPLIRGGLHVRGETTNFPIDDIKVDAKAMQFKLNADPKTGVVKPLAGKFERENFTPILLWRDKEGTKWLVHGHHRLDLAARSGETRIPAQIIDEVADSVTQKQARELGAWYNIRDGHGEVQDYARFFRNSEISEAQSNSQGLFRHNKGRMGFDLGRSSSEGVYSAWLDGAISDDTAAGIARASPGDAGRQAAGLKYALGRGKKASPSQVEAFTAILGRGTKKAGVQGPGYKQGDILGFDDEAIKEAEAMAKVLAKEQEAMRRKLAARGALKDTEMAKESLGVEVPDVASSKAKLDELKTERAWLSMERIITDRGKLNELRAKIGKGPLPETQAALETAAPSPAPPPLPPEPSIQAPLGPKDLEDVVTSEPPPRTYRGKPLFSMRAERGADVELPPPKTLPPVDAGAKVRPGGPIIPPPGRVATPVSPEGKPRVQLLSEQREGRAQFQHDPEQLAPEPPFPGTESYTPGHQAGGAAARRLQEATGAAGIEAEELSIPAINKVLSDTKGKPFTITTWKNPDPSTETPSTMIEARFTTKPPKRGPQPEGIVEPTRDYKFKLSEEAAAVRRAGRERHGVKDVWELDREGKYLTETDKEGQEIFKVRSFHRDETQAITLPDGTVRKFKLARAAVGPEIPGRQGTLSLPEVEPQPIPPEWLAESERRLAIEAEARAAKASERAAERADMDRRFDEELARRADVKALRGFQPKPTERQHIPLDPFEEQFPAPEHLPGPKERSLASKRAQRAIEEERLASELARRAEAAARKPLEAPAARAEREALDPFATRARPPPGAISPIAKGERAAKVRFFERRPGEEEAPAIEAKPYKTTGAKGKKVGTIPERRPPERMATKAQAMTPAYKTAQALEAIAYGLEIPERATRAVLKGIGIATGTGFPVRNLAARATGLPLTSGSLGAAVGGYLGGKGASLALGTVGTAAGGVAKLGAMGARGISGYLKRLATDPAADEALKRAAETTLKRLGVRGREAFLAGVYLLTQSEEWKRYQAQNKTEKPAMSSSAR